MQHKTVDSQTLTTSFIGYTCTMPDHLKIGGHTWKINYSSDLDDELGKTDWATMTISISSTLHPTVKRSVLLHEIIHACNSTLGDTDMGHALIDSLAEQLYQVFSENNLLNL